MAFESHCSCYRIKVLVFRAFNAHVKVTQALLLRSLISVIDVSCLLSFKGVNRKVFSTPNANRLQFRNKPAYYSTEPKCTAPSRNDVYRILFFFLPRNSQVSSSGGCISLYKCTFRNLKSSFQDSGQMITNLYLLFFILFLPLRVVTGEKNSPTVAHACRKRRLKWVLPQVGGWSTGLATLSL
jgi:hypothetical protein